MTKRKRTRKTVGDLRKDQGGRPSKRKERAIRLIDAALESASQMKNKMLAEMYVWAVEQWVHHENKWYLTLMEHFEQPPVDIETFIDSPDFFGSTDLVLWPEVRKAIIDANKDWWKGGDHATHEILSCGATGTGKSELAKVSTAYHLHILGCLKNPQKVYGLPKATSIVFIIQSAKPHVTKKILYSPLRSYVEQMPWFQKNMRPNKLIESEMYFEDKNIRVVQGGSDADSVLGEALIGGVIDEVNFMAMVLRSKKSEVTTGKSGTYDQAQNLYDTVTRRRKGRFVYPAQHIGMFCVGSSTRYKGDFTDRRLDFIKETNEKNVYVYRKAQYEARPQEKYSGKYFWITVENDASMDIKIHEEDTQPKSEGQKYRIPTDYLSDFQKDPHGSLRDVVGVSVNSINPFFRLRRYIMESVQRAEEKGIKSFLNKDNVILGVDGMPLVYRGHKCEDRGKPRYVHIDLSVNNDRCGIAMVRMDGMVEKEREHGVVELMPTATVELSVTIQPDHETEIDFAEIRAWVKRLKVRHGYPIRAISYDGVISIESRQEWKKQGMPAGYISVDRYPDNYTHFRDALYDHRVTLINNPVVVQEMYDLEHDEKTGKIDHRVDTTKDGIDAIVGAFTLMMSRTSTWTEYVGDDYRPDPDRYGHDEDDRYEIAR